MNRSGSKQRPRLSIILFRHEAGTVIFEDPVTYTVTFIDWDGSVIDVQLVEEGGAAAAPEAPVRPGWIFTGWDCDFSCVTSDLTVTALYERVPLLIGDSNCDGKVTMADVTSLIAHIMNAAPLSEQGALNADANGDGTVSILDAAAIYTIALSS